MKIQYKPLNYQKKKNLLSLIRMFRKFDTVDKKFYYPIIKTYMDELLNKKHYKILYYYKYLK